MRPLVVFSGQGVARADGFNLTRRAKALPEFRALLPRMDRSDRQNLDALLRMAVESGTPPSTWITGLRNLCLKERRTTSRKLAHRGTFQALAEAAASRLVVHLTANVDGLTTTFLARDFGARWAPYHAPSTLDVIARDVSEACVAGRGLLHFPLHGEIGLYVSEGGARQLRTAYHHPNVEGDGTVWVSSLVVGPGQGLSRLSDAMPSSRLAETLVQDLLRGEPIETQDSRTVRFAPADLLVLGYGANARGARAEHPFERMIARLAPGRGPGAGRWRALVYAPTVTRHVTQWYEDHGFAVVPYGDGDLSSVTSSLVQPPESARTVAHPSPA